MAWNWQHPNWPNFTWKSTLLSQSVIEAMQHQSLAEHGGLAGIRDLRSVGICSRTVQE